MITRDDLEKWAEERAVDPFVTDRYDFRTGALEMLDLLYPFLELYYKLQLDPNPYSTDISFAFMVIEKIASGPRRWTLNCLFRDPEDGLWAFGAPDREGDIWPRDKAETAPHAICLAALEAVK